LKFTQTIFYSLASSKMDMNTHQLPQRYGLRYLYRKTFCHEITSDQCWHDSFSDATMKLY